MQTDTRPRSLLATIRLLLFGASTVGLQVDPRPMIEPFLEPPPDFTGGLGRHMTPLRADAARAMGAVNRESGNRLFSA